MDEIISDRLPPHGGSGLKYGFQQSLQDDPRLPPHGGSGLKLDMVGDLADHIQSPSTRREWIEMTGGWRRASLTVVSLHTEGVD